MDREFDMDGHENSNEPSNSNSNSKEMNNGENHNNSNRRNRRQDLVNAFGSKQAQSALRKQEALQKTHDTLAAVNETDSSSFQMTKKRKDENIDIDDNDNDNDDDDDDSDEDYNGENDNRNENINNDNSGTSDSDSDSDDDDSDNEDELTQELREPMGLDDDLDEPPKKKRKIDRSLVNRMKDEINRDKNNRNNRKEEKEKEKEKEMEKGNWNIFDLIHDRGVIFSFPPIKNKHNVYEVYDLKQILPKYVWDGLNTMYDYYEDMETDEPEYIRYSKLWNLKF